MKTQSLRLLRKLARPFRRDGYQALSGGMGMEDNGTFPFFRLPRELRDMIYDYLLERPILQVIATSDLLLFIVSTRRHPAKHVRRLYHSTFGDQHHHLDPPGLTLGPTYGRMRQECCLTGSLVCHRMWQELIAREVWRARNNDMLLVLQMEDLACLGIPRKLLASNPEQLHVRVILRKEQDTCCQGLAEALRTIQAYAQELAARLSNLKRLNITIHVERNRDRWNVCGLANVLLNSGILPQSPPSWPQGTALAIDYFDDVPAVFGRRLCLLSVFVEGCRMVRRQDREARYKEHSDLPWRSFYPGSDSWVRKKMDTSLKRFLGAERVAVQHGFEGASNVLF